MASAFASPAYRTRRKGVKRRFLCAFVTAIGLACGLPTSALAGQIGFRNLGTGLPSDGPNVRRASQAFAACMVRAGYGDMRRFVVEDWPLERVASELLGRDYWVDCSEDIKRAISGRTSLFSQGEALRREMAQALVEMELSRWPDLENLQSLPPLIFDGVIAARQRNAPPSSGHSPAHAAPPVYDDAQAAADRSVYRTIDCAVRANPAAAGQVFRRLVASRAETAALARFRADAAVCAHSDIQILASPSQMRGAIAVVYYRLAAASGRLPELKVR